MSGTISAITSYASISKNETANVAKFATSDAQTKADIAYFQKQAPKLTTVAALLKDYRSLSIVLSAFGMSANASQPALVRALITQDPKTTTSLAYKSGNINYQRFAAAMAQWTTPPFANSINVQAIVTAVQTNNFEASADKQAPGVADALYFKRVIGGVTDVNQILSDPKLTAVVTTAANLGTQFGLMDYDKQVALLKKSIDLSKVGDAGYVQKMAQRYLALNGTTTTSNGSGTSALALLTGNTGNAGSTDLLTALYPGASSSSGSSILSLFG